MTLTVEVHDSNEYDKKFELRAFDYTTGFKYSIHLEEKKRNSNLYLRKKKQQIQKQFELYQKLNDILKNLDVAMKEVGNGRNVGVFHSSTRKDNIVRRRFELKENFHLVLSIVRKEDAAKHHFEIEASYEKYMPTYGWWKRFPFSTFPLTSSMKIDIENTVKTEMSLTDNLPKMKDMILDAYEKNGYVVGDRSESTYYILKAEEISNSRSLFRFFIQEKGGKKEDIVVLLKHTDNGKMIHIGVEEMKHGYNNVKTIYKGYDIPFSMEEKLGKSVIEYLQRQRDQIKTEKNEKEKSTFLLKRFFSNLI